MAIRPEDFSNPDQPLPPRSMGIEVEYTLQSQYAASAFTSSDLLSRLGIAHHGQFLGSELGSGRMYPDLGMIEFDTAEAMGPAAAAAEDHKGIGRVSRILEDSGYSYKALYRTAGSYLPFRTPEGKLIDGVTTGCHESLLVSRQVSVSGLLRRVLPTALALRAVWAGAGTLRGDAYVWSQKVWGIGGDPIEYSLSRRTYHTKKPMVIIPPVSSDADTIGDDRFARAEIRMADPSLSVVNEFASLADASLALRLVELQKLVGHDALTALCLVNPVDSAKRFAADLTLTHTEPTLGGTYVTALDGQESLLDQFEALNELVELPPDEQLAIAVIRTMVDALRESRPALAEYVKLAAVRSGAAARHRHLARGRKLADLRVRNKEAMGENLAWDRVLPQGKGMAFWAKVAAGDTMVAKVHELAATAGLTPRARHRAAIIDGDGSGSMVVNWSSYADGRGQRRSLGSAYGD